MLVGTPLSLMNNQIRFFSLFPSLGEEVISLRNATQQRETDYTNEGTLSISLMQIDMSTAVTV